MKDPVDIVERLRTVYQNLREIGYDTYAKEAADTIESLRQRVKELEVGEAFYRHTVLQRDAAWHENEKLSQRVKELEAVLEKVNNEFGCQTVDWPEPWRRIAELKEANRRCYREVAELCKAQGEPVYYEHNRRQQGVRVDGPVGPVAEE